MKKFYRRNAFKLALVSLVFLLTISAFALKFTVSAGSSLTEPIQKSSANSGSDLQNERAKQIVESPVFKSFDAWLGQFQSGLFRGNDEQIRRGESLAIERAGLFKELIKIAPEAALRHSVSDEAKNNLPSSIAEKIERRVSAYGDFLVIGVDAINSETGHLNGGIEREVAFGNTHYKAFVYGRRAEMTTKMNIPLQGVILDDVMAVDENPARIIAPSAYEVNKVDAEKAVENSVVAEVGGELKYFSNGQELDKFINEQIEWESKIGPVRPDENQAVNSSWTEGAKTVLVIRVDFPDRTGEPLDASNQPLTVTRAQNLFTNEVNPFYISNSYNKTNVTATVTPVVRLPQPQSYYVQNSTTTTELLNDARTASRNAGFEPNNYSLDIAAFSYTTGFAWAGLGYVGGKGTWLNGYFDLRVTAHELGHNYGLSHANLWRTTDGTVIGAGNSVEYGDPFDMMGFGGSSAYHFNASYKRTLDWLLDANVQTVTTDGVYRIITHDSSVAGGLRALKIRKNDSKTYWVEFRQLHTSNSASMNGATIRWTVSPSTQTNILDMTPNTSTNSADSPLVIGQTFTDNENRLKITPIGKGNTSPESLDVRVELNVGCTFSLGTTSQNVSASGGEGTFTVTTQSGCNPFATGNQNWITPVSSSESAGVTTVRYIVAANYGAQRTGTINVSGQTFTVIQSAAATACAVPPSGMVAWWRGEGNGLDETGVNNGNVGSGLSYGGAKVGGGFKGVSTNQITTRMLVPDSPSMALDRSLSIEGWIKIDATGNYTILSRNDARDYNGPYVIYSFGERIFFRIASAPSGTSAQIGNSTAFSLGQFHHFAATLDDATGQMKLYIDGTLSAQTTTIVRPFKDLLPSQGPGIAVGNLNGGLVYSAIPGMIDELSVYNRALTLAEVQTIYNAGTATSGSTGKCLQTNRKTPFDFDGDSKTDLGIFRPNTNAWWINRSSSNQSIATEFGTGSDIKVPADYTGDGKTDVAFYRASTGQWFILRSEDFSFYGFPFGASEDIPSAGDFDGDGKADPTLYRPSTGAWYILLSSGGTSIQQFGIPEDKPVVADYDGDGKSDIAIFRPSSAQWWILKSTGGVYAAQFGATGDKTVQGDYTGDGKADIAFWRPSNGFWYILRSEDSSFYGFPFGSTNDMPAPGDYDGDGKYDATVFRPSNSAFYSQMSGGGFMSVVYGLSGDQPIANAFVR